MKNNIKTAIVAGATLAGMVFSASQVYADGTTPTPTPTVTPEEETRVECTTGSYGQQTCKTVVITPAPEKPKHEVVNSGLQENIIAVLIVGFALSSASYAYAKVNR